MPVNVDVSAVLGGIKVDVSPGVLEYVKTLNIIVVNVTDVNIAFSKVYLQCQ